MRFNCYEEAARRVAELESLLTAKGNKAIKKAMLPQPLPKGEFYTYNALTLMFLGYKSSACKNIQQVNKSG